MGDADGLRLDIAAALGDEANGFTVHAMQYESGPQGEDPDWLAVDFTATRSGEAHRRSGSFLSAGELPLFAEWIERLASRADAEDSGKLAPSQRPLLTLEEPVELEALGWGAGRAKLQITFYVYPPWPEHPDSLGNERVVLDTDSAQLRAFADALRTYSAALPPQDSDNRSMLITWLIGAALVAVLALAAVGLVSTVRWLLGP